MSVQSRTILRWPSLADRTKVVDSAVITYPGDPRKLNRAYGNGVFRRRIALSRGAGEILAELEDNQHGFRLVVCHDTQRVTDIRVETLRIPFNTCPGAAEPLRGMVGVPLDIDVAGLRNAIPPGDNCNHLSDLATLALAHYRRGDTTRVYDVEVPDEREGEFAARVAVDGETVHDWRLRQHSLVAPARLAGKSMLQGMYGWASAEFDAEALEAALVLQRGYFVAQARFFDFAGSAGAPASDDNRPEGSCYAYNRGVVEKGVRTGTTVDFTDSPEQLLQFK